MFGQAQVAIWQIYATQINRRYKHSTIVNYNSRVLVVTSKSLTYITSIEMKIMNVKFFYDWPLYAAW